MSIAAAVVQSSILGLEPNSVLGEAYLVPFKGQCVLIPGWKGLLKLVRNSGQLITVTAQAVHQNDEFDPEGDGDALEPRLIHRRAKGERGPVTGYWAGAVLKGGGKQVVYMTWAEVEAHGKKYSKAYSNPASGWQTDFDAMGLKTCIRKLCKYLPQSVEMQIAMDLADRAEAGMTQRFSIDVPMELHPVIEDAADEPGQIAEPQAKTEAAAAAPPTDQVITGVQAQRLQQIAGESGWREKEFLPWLKDQFNVAAIAQIRVADYERCVALVKVGGSEPPK